MNYIKNTFPVLEIKELKDHLYYLDKNDNYFDIDNNKLFFTKILKKKIYIL